MKVQITSNKKPKVSQLTSSLWQRPDNKTFLPTRMFGDGRWYLVDMGDPANGYKRAGDGWLTVTDMFDDVKEQFECLIPVDSTTLCVNSSDIVSL